MTATVGGWVAQIQHTIQEILRSSISFGWLLERRWNSVYRKQLAFLFFLSKVHKLTIFGVTTVE
jgi:hypothetical protein